jgi:hypothetical protein
MGTAAEIRAGRYSPEYWCLRWKPRVLHPVRGLIDFEPYPYQVELMRELARPQGVITNKARQIGVSTSAMIEAVRQCIEFGPKLFLDGSKTEEVAKQLLGIAKLAAETHKRPHAPNLTKAGTQELRWSNGSVIRCLTATRDMGRSYPSSVFILDEVAFIEDLESVLTSMRPTASRTGRYWLFSTPAGEGDTWHTMWNDGTLVARRSTYPWRSCPEYDEAWYERERPNYTAQQWSSEFECSFRGSGTAPFRGEAIDRCLKLGEQQFALHGPALRDRKGRSVFTGVDPSGEGEDDSVAVSMDSALRPWTLIDGEHWESVPSPILQAGVESHQKRHESRLIVENNGVGWGMVQNLDCPVRTITTTSGKQAHSDKGNWTVPKTILLNACILAMENGQLAIPLGLMGSDSTPIFQELVKQLRGYRWDDKGLRTDWVMALADAVWLAGREAGQVFIFSSSDGDEVAPETVRQQLERVTAGAAPGGTEAKEILLPGYEDEPAGMSVVGYGQIGGDLMSIEEAQRLGSDGEPVT